MPTTTITMSISLPKPMHEQIKRRSKDANYGTPSDYIRSLVREDLKRIEKEQLEQELLKGLRSKSRTMTPQAWEKLKSTILESIKH
jgi:antitoxin ParD1/3/4